MIEERWRIELLAGLRATQECRVVTRFRTRKSALLLAYLAYNLEQSHPRETLYELLWPGADPERGRNNLSKELTALRQLLEPPGVPAGAILRADRFSIGLNPAAITTDTAQFELAVQAAARARSATEGRQRLTDAVALYRGEFLPGFFEAWVLQERQWLAELQFETRRQLAASFEEAGEREAALRIARRTVEADPLREEAQRDLMRLLAACGQQQAALRQHALLEALLEQHWGAAPDEETAALARELAQQVGPAPAIRQAAKRAAGESPSSTRASATPETAPLPTGTLTFLLAESAASASPPAQTGAGFSCPGEESVQSLRPLLSGYGGVDLGEAEEPLQFVFGRVSDALAAALAAMAGAPRAAQPSGQIRIALHTGEVEPDAPPRQSLPLAHAARLLAAAHPGQILLTEAVAALLPRDRAGAAHLTELGRYHLDAGMEPERLYQADGPGAGRRSFPRPNVSPAALGTLPLSFTRFFGREEEIARLHDLLRHPDARLVTLTGPGGSGKTRLALEAARSIDPHIYSARSFVPLLDLSAPQRIPEQVLATLRLPRAPEIPALDQVTALLSSPYVTGSGRTLLVLDNFEHLLADGADVVQTLLERLPSLTCLITSRRLLSLEAERELSVPPLPAPAGPENPADLIHCAAVQLFVDRAQAARPDFQLTVANAPAVAAVCRTLEGIPLAIELAAARAQVLTPGQMLAQMTSALPSEAARGAGPVPGRFDLLVSRRRGTHWRHQSLRATLDWRFQLLPPPLRQLLARLSVFRGGWTLEAAEQICADSSTRDTKGHEEGSTTADILSPPLPSCPFVDESEIRKPEILDDLTQLCGCSLVQAEECAGEMQYRMLETVREYARQQLTPAEQAAVQQRHAEYYLTLAERAEPELEGAGQRFWFARLEREQDNLRAALSWAEGGELGPAHGEPLGLDPGLVGLRLAGALGLFWSSRGDRAEGRRWLEGALSRSGEGGAAHDAARAKALYAAGRLAWDLVDPEAARARCAESVALARQLGEKRLLIRALFTLAWSSVYPGDLATAMEHQMECQALAQEIGDRYGLALSLFLRTRVAFSDDPGGARPDLEASLALFRELGDKRMAANVARELTGVLSWQGEDELAWTCQEEALANFRELGEVRDIARGLRGMGGIAVSRGELAAAHAFYQEGLALVRQLADRGHTAALLTGLGIVNVLRGDYESARQCHQEALALKRQRNARLESAADLHFLGEVAMAQGRWREARELFEEAHAIDREHGIRGGLAAGGRGRAAMELGDLDEARRIFEADLAVKREMGDQRLVATNLHDLGELCFREGQYQTAGALAKESLVLRKMLRGKLRMPASFELLAAVAAAQGQAQRAAILFGAAEGLREALGVPLPPAERAEDERRRQMARATLGEPAFAAARAQGRALSLDAAIELALREGA